MLGVWYQVRQVEEKRMVTQNAAAAGPALPGGRVTEREAWSASGVPVLVLGVGMLLAGAALLVLGIVEGRGAGPTALVVAAVVLFIAGELAVHGLTSVVAGEARAVQQFVSYS